MAGKLKPKHNNTVGAVTVAEHVGVMDTQSPLSPTPRLMGPVVRLPLGLRNQSAVKPRFKVCNSTFLCCEVNLYRRFSYFGSVKCESTQMHKLKCNHTVRNLIHETGRNCTCNAYGEC